VAAERLGDEVELVKSGSRAPALQRAWVTWRSWPVAPAYAAGCSAWTWSHTF
jgi:hypothetical protein